MNRIKLLVDNPNSWMVPYATSIVKRLREKGYDANFINSLEKSEGGWTLFLLSCTKLLKDFTKFKHNIVIHASDLPEGKGWSPLTWQILEGKNQIPISLFEANENLDSGAIYFKDYIKLNGDELIDEIRSSLVIKIEEMIFKFLSSENLNPIVQNGKSTIFRKRNPEDSKLDPKKTIEEQFNLLRVCDNNRYPAYFILNGKKYLIKIFNYENF